MNVWIITVGEPLPIDGTSPRLFRSSILANYLLNRGHKVVRWTSTFDHSKKIHRFEGNRDVQIDPNYTIRCIHSIGYKKNISFRRIYDHLDIARKFRRISREVLVKDKPDVIFCSFPTIELSVEACNYGEINNIPVILDIRDLWPDIFVDAFPKKLKLIGKIFLYPFFLKTQNAFKKAYAITGITEEFVNWGVKYANREKDLNDRPFPFGYQRNSFLEEQIEDSNRFWNKNGVTNKEFNIAIISSINRVFDINLIIDAATALQQKNIPAKIVICGVGDLLPVLIEKSKGLANIKIIGWVDGSQIASLMEISSVGVIPYINRQDFMDSIPNKISEYMSAGLPIISSLKGVVQKILTDKNCGIFVKDSEDLINAIIQLYLHPELLKKMQTNSINYFETHFESNLVYNNMCDYLESVTNKIDSSKEI